jgi:hypothetical protein
MRTEIDDPVATVEIRWISAADGGRRSGPPTAPVYVTTCVFPLGGDAEVQPGWPMNADPAMPYIHVGADILVLEGPKPVAHAVVREVLRPPADRAE